MDIRAGVRVYWNNCAVSHGSYLLDGRERDPADRSARIQWSLSNRSRTLIGEAAKPSDSARLTTDQEQHARGYREDLHHRALVRKPEVKHRD